MTRFGGGVVTRSVCAHSGAGTRPAMITRTAALRLIASSVGRADGLTRVLGLLEVLLEEVVQERPDHRDGAELTDVLPRRRDDAADDVRRQLELESEEQPHPEPPPERLAFAVGRTRSEDDLQYAGERLERAVTDDEH